MLVVVRAVRQWVYRFRWDEIKAEVRIVGGNDVWLRADASGARGIATTLFARSYLKRASKYVAREIFLSIFISDLWIMKNSRGRKPDIFIESGTLPVFSFFTPTVVMVEDPLGLFGWKKKRITRHRKFLFILLCRYTKFRGFAFYSIAAEKATRAIFGDRFVNDFSLGIFRPPGLLQSRAGKIPKAPDKIDGVFSFGFVAGNPYGKGVADVLLALRGIEGQVELKLLVPKQYWQKIQKVAESYGISVKFFKWGATEMHSFLVNVDCLVHPTFMDSSAMVVIEALSVDVPVIVSDVFATAELVVEGVNGFIVPRGDDHKFYSESFLPVTDETPLDFFFRMAKDAEKAGNVHSEYADRLRVACKAARVMKRNSTPVNDECLLTKKINEII